jgi:hypothetical protein
MTCSSSLWRLQHASKRDEKEEGMETKKKENNQSCDVGKGGRCIELIPIELMKEHASNRHAFIIGAFINF